VALMIVFAHFFVLAGSDLVWFLEATGFSVQLSVEHCEELHSYEPVARSLWFNMMNDLCFSFFLLFDCMYTDQAFSTTFNADWLSHF
jgi:hypothetical protein